MTAIAGLTEDFDIGPDAAALSPTNTVLDAFSGNTATPPRFSTPSIEGAFSARVQAGDGVTVANSILRADYAALTTIWTGLYLQVEQLPNVATTLLQVASANVIVAAVRLNPDGSIQLRNGTTSVFLSAAGAIAASTTASPTWYRLAVQCTPKAGTGADGVIRLKVYSGANLHGTTPTLDSGAQVSTVAGDATIPTQTDNFRFGAITNVLSTILRFDRLRADDAVEPAGLPVSNAAPTANAGADQTNVAPYATVTLTGSGTDTDGTITGHTWTQTAGPAVTLTGTGTAPRTFTAPALINGTTLTFGLVVTDNGGATSVQDTMTVTVLAHSRFVVAADGTRLPLRRSRV